MSDNPKRSRFDRGTRKSPSPRRRSRSPERGNGNAQPVQAGEAKPADDAVAAAAKAAAARITAQIEARKAAGLDVAAKPTPSLLSAANKSSSAAKNEIYEQDGDFIKDIEVNDLRNRYTLTKGATQKMIKEKTGADVTTRGAYYPDKAMATASEPPLYLHITSQTKEGLEKAVAEIEALKSQDLPNLIDERRFRRREPEDFERDERGRRKWPEEKITIDLEPIRNFPLRYHVVGPGGSYVKHIQNETRCRVQIKGRESGFVEFDTGHESDEQMYLHVAGPDPEQVKRAKELCIELLGSVRAQYDAFKEEALQSTYGDRRGGDNRGPYGDGGGRDRGSYGGGGGDRQPYSQPRQASYGGGSAHEHSYGGGSAYGPTAVQTPMPQASAAQMAPGAPQTADPAAQAAYAAQWQQWQQTNPQEYAAYMAMYQQQYAAYYDQQTGTDGAAGLPGYPGYGTSDTAGQGQPLAPPGNDAGSPSGGAPGTSGGFNAVPPPPGM